MKSLVLSALFSFAALAAQAQTRFHISEIQSFPGYVEVTYDQDVKPAAADILFVIDDSGSMYSHQQNLAKFASDFVHSYINSPNLDVQVGVITTSFNSAQKGELVRTGGYPFVNRLTPNAAEVLKKNLLVGTNGDGTEKPFAALVEALTVAKREGANAGFFRTGAALKVVLFTDAEDQSQEGADIALERLRFVNPVLTVDAFVAETANKCEMDEYNKDPVRIHELVKLAGGKTYPICAEDLAPSLTSILKPADGGVLEIPLPSLADPASINVTYGTQKLWGGAGRTGWTLDEDRNVIVIGSRVVWSAQPEGTRLKVRYVPQDWR